MTAHVARLLLPGGDALPFGGRFPRTPAEQDYACAVRGHAAARRELSQAAESEGDARAAFLDAVARHGPGAADTAAAGRAWAVARKATKRAADDVDAATQAVVTAAERWAACLFAERASAGGWCSTCGGEQGEAHVCGRAAGGSR